MKCSTTSIGVLFAALRAAPANAVANAQPCEPTWMTFPRTALAGDLLAHSSTGGRDTLWIANCLELNGDSTSRIAGLVACPPCPPCPPDWNLDGLLNSSDFLDDFFNANNGPLGDFNRSGTMDSKNA